MNIQNIDCMDLMAKFPDKYFDLAIVDPPYGINVGKMAFLSETKKTVLQKNGKRLSTTKKVHSKKQWDETPPTPQYFNELFRVSKNQIIWGINYFDLPNIGTGRLRWNKGVADGVSFKKYEYAYCSLIENTIDIDLLWAGFCQAKSLSQPMIQQGNKKLNEKRIHPTQKPVLLYKKLLTEYAKPDYKILDTHLGSMSIAIACQDMNIDLTASEIDTEYYNDGIKRIQEHNKQQKIIF